MNSLEQTAKLWRHEIDHCDRQAGARQTRPLTHWQTDRQAPYLLRTPPAVPRKQHRKHQSRYPKAVQKDYRRGCITHQNQLPPLIDSWKGDWKRYSVRGLTTENNCPTATWLSNRRKKERNRKKNYAARPPWPRLSGASAYPDSCSLRYSAERRQPPRTNPAAGCVEPRSIAYVASSIADRLNLN